jgi:hypothetical protein
MHIWYGSIVFLFLLNGVLSITKVSIPRKNSILLQIMFTLLFFLTVFKDNNIFNDIWAYLYAFDYSSSISWSEMLSIQDYAAGLKLETGWWFYTKILSSISNNNIFLIVVTGAIILRSYYVFIKNYSRLPWLSIFLFISTIFYHSFFLMRQSLAVAICLYSIPYIIDRKYVKFLLIIFIAYLLHNTAIIFALLYFIYPKQIRIGDIVKYGVSGLVFYYLFDYTIKIAVSYYTGYEGYLYDLDIQNLTALMISLTVLIFILIQLSPFTKLNNVERLFIVMVILITFIDISRVGLSGTIGRINQYFIPAIIIILPNAIHTMRSKIMKFYSTSAVIILYFIMMVNQMNYGFKLAF